MRLEEEVIYSVRAISRLLSKLCGRDWATASVQEDGSCSISHCIQSIRLVSDQMVAETRVASCTLVSARLELYLVSCTKTR